MSDSPLPGVPQTAAKANVGSLAMAATTIVLYLLARFFGIVAMPDASLVADAVTTLVLAAISAGITWVTVYLTPNKPKDGSTMQSHPGATLFAMGVAFVLFGGFLLGGCAPAVQPAVPAASVSDLDKHIATARQYVTAAEAIADTCIAFKLPLCDTPAKVQAITTAKQVAEEGLAEAQDQADQGVGATLVQTTLRVAMNAVLLFYSLK